MSTNRQRINQLRKTIIKYRTEVQNLEQSATRLADQMKTFETELAKLMVNEPKPIVMILEQYVDHENVVELVEYAKERFGCLLIEHYLWELQSNCGAAANWDYIGIVNGRISVADELDTFSDELEHEDLDTVVIESLGWK